MIVTFSTKLPCIICLKKVCFYFSYAKSTATSVLKFVSEIELQDSLHYSILGEKSVFTLPECVLVNI